MEKNLVKLFTEVKIQHTYYVKNCFFVVWLLIFGNILNEKDKLFE
jgi:hypothetical protein